MDEIQYEISTSSLVLSETIMLVVPMLCKFEEISLAATPQKTSGSHNKKGYLDENGRGEGTEEDQFTCEGCISEAEFSAERWTLISWWLPWVG